MKRLKIAYKKNGHSYEITLKVRFTGVFALAAHRAEIKNKKGEEFVATVLRVAPGAVCEIFRRKDGVKNDGLNGEPAQEHFNRAGGIVRLARFTDDKLNDGANGAAALQTFHGGGKLLYEEHRHQGGLTEGPHRGPATLQFDENGDIVRLGYYTGQHLDYRGPDGEPAPPLHGKTGKYHKKIV